MLNRENIRTLCARRRVEPITLSIGEAHVRALTWSDFQDLRQRSLDAPDGQEVDEAELTVAMGLSDGEGQALLDPGADEDLDLVRNLPGSDFVRLLNAINRISGQIGKLKQEITDAGEG